jgi:hypothetical protein
MTHRFRPLLDLKFTVTRQTNRQRQIRNFVQFAFGMLDVSIFLSLFSSLELADKDVADEMGAPRSGGSGLSIGFCKNISVSFMFESG